jgi:signal transduction histidine kinase
MRPVRGNQGRGVLKQYLIASQKGSEWPWNFRLTGLRPSLGLTLKVLCWFVLAAIALAPRIALGSEQDRLSHYTYEDTKQLVALVEDAAAEIEQKGEAAFKEFGVPNSKWFYDDYYLFVYTTDGTTAFHPIEPRLIGKNIIGLHDMNGKAVIRMITDVAKKPERDASDWVFYLWEYRTQLTPLWKSAYVRKAVAPDGTVYLVGSGLYNMKTERAFVQDRVELACEKLLAEGKDAAFKEFRDPASPFVFLGAYIFVLDEDGHTLVDPAFPTNAGRDLSDFRDAVGMPVIHELFNKLAKTDTAWMQYLWPKPGSPVPTRKLMYARKITVGGETFIVGSDFYLATPIWMHV